MRIICETFPGLKNRARTDELEVYFGKGFSGHGVMHSPASGGIATDLVLEGHSGLIDASQLAIERFKEGKLLEETAVL